MTTALAPRKSTAYYAVETRLSAKGHAIEAQADGTHVIRGVEIFRVGTFRDSWGEQQSWSVEHLQQMVSNFNLLRDADRLPNVPVRLDHTRSIKNVIGYIDALYV